MINKLEENERLRDLDKEANIEDQSSVRQFLFDLKSGHPLSKNLDISSEVQTMKTAEEISEVAKKHGYDFSPYEWIQETHELRILQKNREDDLKMYDTSGSDGFIGSCTIADYIFEALKGFDPASFTDHEIAVF
jgi:hypothetical protein